MAEARQVYLIRHGQTEWNEEGRIQGGKDSPLTARGRRQAEAVAGSLKKNPPVFLYASPLGRASKTASIIAKGYDIAVETDDRLCEHRWGDAEGLTLDEIDARWPDFRKRREQDKWNMPWPEGESYRDVDARLGTFLAEKLEPMLQHVEEGPIGIVGHQAMNMVLLGRLFGLDPAITLRLGQPNHVVYRLEGRMVEHAFLGDDHLDWLPGAVQKRSDEVVLLDAA